MRLSRAADAVVEVVYSIPVFLKGILAMSIIKSLVIAFSMYSKIPMPHLELDEKDMKYVMGFFPLIGLITGALAYGWIYAGEILYVPDISGTLVLIILPVIITGESMLTVIWIHVMHLIHMVTGRRNWQY